MENVLGKRQLEGSGGKNKEITPFNTLFLDSIGTVVSGKFCSGAEARINLQKVVARFKRVLLSQRRSKETA